jgi:hypothetical protein
LNTPRASNLQIPPIPRSNVAIPMPQSRCRNPDAAIPMPQARSRKPDAGGIAAISPGLSEATPRVRPPQSSHPGGMPETPAFPLTPPCDRRSAGGCEKVSPERCRAKATGGPTGRVGGDVAGWAASRWAPSPLGDWPAEGGCGVAVTGRCQATRTPRRYRETWGL